MLCLKSELPLSLFRKLINFCKKKNIYIYIYIFEHFLSQNSSEIAKNIYSCDSKDKKILASLLQSSVLHDPSEIILLRRFAAEETFLIIIHVENSCALNFVHVSY